MNKHQRYLENSVRMWNEEDRPYWRYIRGSCIDDYLRDIFGVESRNLSVK